MMITITTHRSPVKPGLTGHLKTTMNVDGKHHYASLASLAAMMITITTHRVRVKPGLTGHLKCIQKRREKTIHDDDDERG